MKLISTITLILIGLWLGYKQYKFNVQVEWYDNYTGRSAECDKWENQIPTMAKAQLAVKEITKAYYKDWMKSVGEDRRKSCDEFYKWKYLNYGMPFTTEGIKARKEADLDSFKGYIKDLFNPPFKVDGEEWDTVKPSVILKNHWYGGSPGKCFVFAVAPIAGNPLPGLHRYNYALSCINDKSIKEGVRGFIAISTSNNLEKIQ